ncbi:MAG: FAD-dependent thymidylate synthase [Anaerolineaceae bacterium]
MPPVRQVYLLDPQKLKPETIAVTFAKTSRSPQSFREIAAELTEEKSAEFNEKWVVGYGHSSVAEHAVLHLAVENISRLAVECLESNRLASYTEKSTRYQKWTSQDYFIPEELSGSRLLAIYRQTCERLFSTYRHSLEVVRAHFLKIYPPAAGESEAAWERKYRSDYIDVCRFLLPAASLANVGVTINARGLEHAIQKLLSHPLAEVRAVGEEIKAAAIAETPTLVKYADALPYLEKTRQSITLVAASLGDNESDVNGLPGRLISYDRESEVNILAAALFRFGQSDLIAMRNAVEAMSAEQRLALANKLFAERSPHDAPLRELEYGNFLFEITVDQGAYFEIKRHRMMTQTVQPLTASLGYAVPRMIVEAGMRDEYCRAFDKARQAFETIARENPEVASYVVPNGFNRRLLMSFNLRSADHFISLRTAPNAHFSVRRVAHWMAEEIRAALPVLGAYLRECPGESWQDVEKKYFSQV